MRTKILIASILILIITTLSFAGLPAVLSKPSSFPELLSATGKDVNPNGCVNCHQPRPDIGRDLRLSVLISDIGAHNRSVVNAVSTSEIPTICKTCHQSQLGNTLHLIHLGYRITPENTSTINYARECFYCHAPNRSTGSISFKTGYEAKP
ncbi:MAG: hypothetical protein M1503_08700 [Thaumarchaeota archaeon]|nr:hypothetical protein [Nitrososphaerota archaeon]MCL5318317.1 hypothetical protein [Nitrososphaerota archaeon]